jgi:NAD(P)-dependent dehydrogenase (short-subunit alcohol dehydrogenase family)
MNKTAVVTGAGSGVGRAVALALAGAGWRVAITGRRLDALKQTAKLAENGRLSVFPCDLKDEAAVAKFGRQVLEQLGAVEVLVNAAGTNVPQRGLAELSTADYRSVIDTNLNGAYYCVQAFLPAMREQKSGTVVNIVSDAAKQASAKAGPSYVMSKFGLAGLTQSINAEEQIHGIRACAIFPGDIDTPLLERRPTPPPAEARAKMLRGEDVAACVLLVINLPMRAVVEDILLRPLKSAH